VSAGLVLLGLIAPGFAVAWDPVGDVTHPDRIIRNTKREIKRAGKKIDNARLEMQAATLGPALCEAIRESRPSHGLRPIPENIRDDLRRFGFDDRLLSRVRWKTGEGGELSVARNSIRFGDAAAVTLIDVVIFRDADDALQNVPIWAHELTHVRQFDNWGCKDFGIKYVRSWNRVEDAAYDVQDRVESKLAFLERQYERERPGGTGQRMPFSRWCRTEVGDCRTRPDRIGTPCECFDSRTDEVFEGEID
jgi:hypothetical protein